MIRSGFILFSHALRRGILASAATLSIAEPGVR
jgi:hypothetical protein